MFKKTSVIYFALLSSPLFASNDTSLGLKGILTDHSKQGEIEISHGYTFLNKLYLGIGAGIGIKTETEKDLSEKTISSFFEEKSEELERFTFRQHTSTRHTSMNRTSRKRTSTQHTSTKHTSTKSSSTKRTFYGEITPRLGYNFDNFVVYSLFSPRWAQQESEIKINSLTFKKNKSYLKFGIGVGINVKLVKHCGIGTEYKYFIDSKRSNDNEHQVLLKVSYHF